jgi:hypothetical protein
METDSTRWQPNLDLLQALTETEFADHLDAANTGGYVGTPLSGVWATAPYLHNGSVPTLWHLMHPAERPGRFMVGGHRLDFTRVGIDGTLDSDGLYAFPESYRPWSTPQEYDASRPGLGNGGHATQFEDMTEQAKRALIEFLKLL